MDPGLVLVVGGLAAAGVAALVSNLRTRKEFARQRTQSLEEARAEVQSHTSAMAEKILAITDQMATTEVIDPELRRLFADATEDYQRAQDHLERTNSARELELVADELDHARWQLAAVEARLDGHEAPPEPSQNRACFFDPTHGAGTEDAAISTPAGERNVRVCSYCAAKLRSGSDVEPRMIEVGGRRIPAPMAPRSYGGGGYVDLDDFSIIFGGSRRHYGWGGYGGAWSTRGRRSWGSDGAFGGGFSGGYGSGRR